MIDDPDLNRAMFEAVAPLVGVARTYGQLPAVTSDAFLTAPMVVRQAALMVVGIARVHLGDPVLALLKETSIDVRGAADWRYLISGGQTTYRPTPDADPEPALLPYPGHVPHEVVQRRRGAAA